MRIPLNCWIVAMWLWLAGHAKHPVWTRRSHSFRGLLLHFGVSEATGWRTLRVIEYIPPRRDLWTRKNMLVLFHGDYRVWEFRLTKVRRVKTMKEAVSTGKAGKNDIRSSI